MIDISTLESLIKDLNLPKEDLTISTRCSQGKILIDLDIMHGGKERSRLYFAIHPESRIAECEDIELDNPLKGKGLGRKLVVFMEKVARSYGCEKTIITIDLNRRFWNHMGYSPMQNAGSYKLLNVA